MLTALVLVCSLAITPDIRDCDAASARIVMRVPELYASPVTCAMHGQAYLAETAVGRNLTGNDRLKVVCQHQDKIDEIIAKLPTR
jgi:hypothetical protein